MMANMLRRALLLLAPLLAAGAVLHGSQVSYVPNRVLDGARGQFSDFESMVADLARADVVFLGEQHDDPNTHRLQLALLEGLARRRAEIVLSLEMFERDVQEPLDHFTMGHSEEAEFLRDVRPWPRYASDYKPLVDFAIAKKWAVIAANVPRSIASEVSKGGLELLKGKSDADRKLFARELRCPLDDDYFKRFDAAMGGHSAGGATAAAAPAADAKRQTTERYYFAQCVKDETMAESVGAAYVSGAIGGKRPLVVHVTGSFHSDFGAGTAERTRRRLPDKRIVITTFLPVANLDQIEADAKERKRADFLVYTLGK